MNKKMKVFSKKASVEILTILIAMAVFGSIGFVVYNKMNSTFRGSSNAINTRLSTQVGNFNNVPSNVNTN